MATNNGQHFQDRKLNKCRVCGTHKQIGAVFVPGKVYFLCRACSFLDSELEKARQKLLSAL